jgi:hypothetical protein
MLLIHPNSINLIHKGRARVKVIVRWLVLVKINGNKPRKLLNRTSENNDTNSRVIPFLLFPRRILNSLCNFVVSRFHDIVCREGLNHNLVGININPRNVLVQLRGIFDILVVGSNTENKFLIIFSL